MKKLRMKYLILALTCLLAQALAEESNRCDTDDRGIKLYSPLMIDLAKTQAITYGRCLDEFQTTNRITGYRVYYETLPKRTIYIDLEISPQPGFGYSIYKEAVQQIDISSILSHVVNVSSKKYNIELQFRGKSTEGSDYELLKTFGLIIKDSALQSETVTDPTGSWYDRTLSGTGFVVMLFENGTVVQYYGYDSDGKRLWLLSDVIDEAWVRAEAKTLTMYEGKADVFTNFTTPPANVPGIAKWGNIEIRFDNCDVGYAKLSGTDGEQTFNLTKLAAPSGVHCMAQ